MKICVYPLFFFCFVSAGTARAESTGDEVISYKYSWCLDIGTIKYEEVYKLYEAAENNVLRHQDVFSNSSNFYYEVQLGGRPKLLLILSDHSWIRGLFDVDRSARAFIETADSLTVENDGLLPNKFSSLNWEKADETPGGEKMADILSHFSDSEIVLLKKVMREDFGTDEKALRLKLSVQVFNALQAATSHGCDNRFANTMSATFGGVDQKLAVQFLSVRPRTYRVIRIG